MYRMHIYHEYTRYGSDWFKWTKVNSLKILPMFLKLVFSSFCFHKVSGLEDVLSFNLIMQMVLLIPPAACLWLTLTSIVATSVYGCWAPRSGPDLMGSHVITTTSGHMWHSQWPESRGGRGQLNQHVTYPQTGFYSAFMPYSPSQCTSLTSMRRKPNFLPKWS